jgi:L-threonylcarbamoyladenylate synthase
VSAEILAPTAENMDRVQRALLAGEVVAIPTETVYGLAGVATDAGAVAKIFACKERPTFDPLIVHVSGHVRWREACFGDRGPLGALAAQGVVDEGGLTEVARARVERLMRGFWPGPLTLVLPRGEAIPDLVTSGLDTVAVRMPRHQVADGLLWLVGKPLAAPSANRFGRISPTTAQHVAAELGDRIGLIVDGGACAVGVESTIVAVDRDGGLTLLRPGMLGADKLGAVAGVTVARAARVSDERPTAPGMLASHYAPRKPLRLGVPGGDVGYLAFSGDAAAIEAGLGPRAVVRVLSPSGDVAEAARNLFAYLRELDESHAETLVAEPVPAALAGDGLGHAIADRLARAAAAR